MSNAVELDAALSKPLAEIPDNGFSDAVRVRLIEMRTRRERLTVMVIAGAAALACLAMPFTEIGQAINGWVLALGQEASTPLKVVAGALVLSGLIVQLFSGARGSRSSSSRISS